MCITFENAVHVGDKVKESEKSVLRLVVWLPPENRQRKPLRNVRSHFVRYETLLKGKYEATEESVKYVELIFISKNVMLVLRLGRYIYCS